MSSKRDQVIIVLKKTTIPLLSNRFQAYEPEKKLKGPLWLKELSISR